MVHQHTATHVYIISEISRLNTMANNQLFISTILINNTKHIGVQECSIQYTTSHIFHRIAIEQDQMIVLSITDFDFSGEYRAEKMYDVKS